MNKNHKIYTVLLAFLVLFSYSTKAQWNIPADASAKKSPLEINADNVLKGKDIYYKSCNACHGDPQAGNAVPLNPPPTDLGSADFLKKRTEGDIFYQVSTGMGGMPPFASSLSEEDRWAVVQYLRNYIPEIAVDLSKKKIEGEIKLELDEKSHKINAVLTGKNDEGETVALQGVKLAFFVKRYFGNLPIGTGTTNEKGYAAVSFPTDLPGDSVGTAQVIVKVTDTHDYKVADITENIAWAKPFHYINPLDTKAMWGNRSMTPTWLLITYLSVVGGVWFTILWVVSRLFKIKKLGKQAD